MWKNLAILAFTALVPVSVSSQPSKAVSSNEHPATQEQPVAPKAVPGEQAESAANRAQTDPTVLTRYAHIKWPRWMFDSNWWLVIAAFGTALVIGWQSFATAKSAKAAFLQIQMMKDKERARIEIHTSGLEVRNEGEDFWTLKTAIALRNIGMGRAYVRQGLGSLVITNREDEPPADPDYWGLLGVVDGFIDANGEPLTEPFYFFPSEKLDLSNFAQRISEGRVRLYITGFIEYETVGTRFHRDFNYRWVGHDDPESVSGMFGGNLFKPTTDMEKVSFGFWRQHPFRENDEYEVESPRKIKRRPKAT